MSKYELYISALRQYREYQRLCSAHWSGAERERVAACRREREAYLAAVYDYWQAGGTRQLPILCDW